MPVPFRDLNGDTDLGLAGFLRFEEEASGKGMGAALFLMTGRGEPIEFSFTRINVAGSFLWRAGDARRHAVTALSKALFESVSREPNLLLALAEEVPPQVFTEDLEVQVPMCRIASSDTTVHAAVEHLEQLPEQAPELAPELENEALNLFWVGKSPPIDSPARRLLEALHNRKLLTEPFERASAGLAEASKNP